MRLEAQSSLRDLLIQNNCIELLATENTKQVKESRYELTLIIIIPCCLWQRLIGTELKLCNTLAGRVASLSMWLFLFLDYILTFLLIYGIILDITLRKDAKK